MSPRKSAIIKAIADAHASRVDVESLSREYTLAHNAFNTAVTEAPTRGRRSGTDLENLRLHAVSAYEALLDMMRIHHDNLAHLQALKGKLP